MPRFEACKRAAIDLLLDSDVTELPFDVRDLNFSEPILFDSMQNYCHLTGISIDQLMPGGNFQDGFNIIFPALSIVLYNSESSISPRRMNWTLGHEVGHLVMGHKEGSPNEEVEANFFTANLFMPDAVLYEFHRRGVVISPSFLVNYFGVSVDAAKRKLRTLYKSYRHDDFYIYRHDEVAEKFAEFIEKSAKSHFKIERFTQQIMGVIR